VSAGRPPPRAEGGAAAGVRAAALLGAGCFALVALLGQGAAFALRFLSHGRLSLATSAEIGWLYVGAFHHVPIVVDLAELDVGRLTGGVTPGSTLPTSGSVSGEIGVALLLVTGLAAWLLYRAGHRAASSGGGGPLARTLVGLAVAPAYALPIFALSLVVRLHDELTFGTLASGRLDARLSPIAALVLPLVIASIAGGAGGFMSAVAEDRGVRARRAAGALAGGWRMLLLALALTFVGLFVAGAAQPDGPAATLTPSTARYFRMVFSRPAVGLAVFAHHVAAAPNEAMWTLVPAMGGCDGASGSISTAFLCYWRFPRSVTLPGTEQFGGSTGGSGRSTFGVAPFLYFAFLLVPATAAFWGGRHAASRGRADTPREGGIVGAAAGVVFAGLVAAAASLSGVAVTYSAAFRPEAGTGSVWVGPFVLSGALLALMWGVSFGWLGGRSQVRARESGATRALPRPINGS
jgi:hypothetical protein